MFWSLIVRFCDLSEDLGWAHGPVVAFVLICAISDSPVGLVFGNSTLPLQGACSCKVDAGFTRSSYMEWAPKLLGFLVSGAHSNWWGIGCPAHCFGSGIPSLALAFLLGLCFGSLVTLALGFWALGLLHPPHPAQAWVSPPPSVAPASDRLRAYLDEQSLLPLQRRRRGA